MRSGGVPSNKGIKLTEPCYHHERLGSSAAYPRCSADMRVVGEIFVDEGEALTWTSRP